MDEYLSHTEMERQVQQEPIVLPHDYDPLQEIYHWSLIVFLLLGETILVGISFAPQIDSVSFLTTLLIWHINFGMALLLGARHPNARRGPLFTSLIANR